MEKHQQLKLTSIFRQNAEAYYEGYRRAVNQGGTYSSKTYSCLQLLDFIAEYSKVRNLISVVSESLPHLRKGAIRDFRDILGNTFVDSRYNKTEQTYTYPRNGSMIEFFGADESAKVRGPRRDILYINEANNVPWETARGLDVRTRKFTLIDFNPVSEFWAHEHWIDKPENAYIHSTYRDALEVVPKEIIANILATGKDDPNWANVYLEGKVGKVEGLVYPYFEQVDELPTGDYFYGLDWGFTNDYTALTKHVIIEKNLYSKELIYEKGLTNDAIAARMGELGIQSGYDEIFADSAEPKSIKEVFNLGFNVKGVTKGPGSVKFGQQKVLQYKQHWTKDSTNCIKEQRNFRYIPDKDGNLTDKTTHIYSHGMDSRRYAVVGKIGSYFDIG